MTQFSFLISQFYLGFLSLIFHWSAASGLLILLAYFAEICVSTQRIKDSFLLWKSTLIGILVFPVVFHFLPEWIAFPITVSDLTAHLSWYGIVFWIYLTGFTFRMALFLLQLKDQRNLVRSSRLCTVDWMNRAAVSLSASMNLRQNIQVKQSAVISSPFVTGVFRPIVILPDFVLHQFSKKEIRMILAHELSHIRHRDMVYDRFLTWIQMVLWFFPAAYAVKMRIEHHRELACDFHAIQLCGSPKRYAEMFVHLAEALLPKPAAECGLSLLKRGTKTMKRFDRILRYSHDSLHPSTPAFRYSVISVMLIFMVLISGVRISLTQQIDPPRFDPPRLENIDTVVLNVQESNLLFPTLPVPNPAFVQVGILPLASYAMQVEDVFWIVDHPDTLQAFPLAERGVSQKPVSSLVLTPVVAALAGGRTTSPRDFLLEASKGSFLFFSSHDRRAIENENPQSLGGIHIVDVSNPNLPKLAAQVSAAAAGGVNIIGDTLYARISEDIGTLSFPNFFVAFDVTNPAQPQELWRIPLPNNEFFFSAAVHPSDPSILYIAGQDIFVYRLGEGEPTLLSRWEFENRNFSVLDLKTFTDGLFCVTQSRPQNGLDSINDLQTVEHRWIHLSTPETPGTMTSLPFVNHQPDRLVHVNTLFYNNHFLTVINGTFNRGGAFVSRVSGGESLLPAAYFPLWHEVIPAVQAGLEDRQEVWLGNDPLLIYSLESLIPSTSIKHWNTWER